MRLMDVVLAFPALILAIAIVTVIGSGLIQAQMAIGIVAIPIYARVMRASVLSIKERDFVTASRALGESDRGILVRRILPNALTPLIVQGTLGIGGAVLEVAALSFLGLGAQPPHRRVGQHDRPEPQLRSSTPRTSSSSRASPEPYRARLQPARRRHARRTRPEAQPMTISELAEPRRSRGSRGAPLLEVKGLQTSFHTRDGIVRAVTGIDFHVNRGEILGLVGESGCGKSVTSLSILRLIAPPGRIEAGRASASTARTCIKLATTRCASCAATGSA